jgi:hemerythrin
MRMPWTENLSVGVETIDEQHKTWFEKAEKLFEAGKNRQAAGYIGELLEFLEDYTKKHFADEKKYMQSIGYPGLPEQQKAHAAFIQQLAQLSADFKSSGSNLLVIINANTMVLGWLTNHISHMDKKIGEFAKAKK